MIGSDLYWRAVLSLVLVLGLVVLCHFLLRRYGGSLVSRNPGTKRLRVLETLSIDARHRLVLIRRDDREHLLLLGPAQSLVVEDKISRPVDFGTVLSATSP